ncbi:protein kinase [Streptomyces sp. BE20]|uniref:protein kinase domain-containing protein n=1 Tax=Streptomyces sp. BE20 TaxID=3002525 RepID=UPI002E784ED8|nr:protein kinase [Streptomyces sp. BE20]MEE1825665.1 protein kinase [Streptomyces sp. BE20]
MEPLDRARAAEPVPGDPAGAPAGAAPAGGRAAGGRAAVEVATAGTDEQAVGEPVFEVPPGYPVAGYLVGEPIGAGAWGSVYAARKDGTAPGSAPGSAEPPDAAVKFLRPALLSPGQRRTMEQVARSEMRFSRLADHPHLIRTLAVVTVRDRAHPGLDGAVALVMERADRSLQDVLASAGPPGAVPGAERILAEVGAGLTHMHAVGWVHGDLKPGNVLLMPDGTAKLADFGLTAELEGTHAYAPPLGSPDHVPPEWWSQRTGARGVALRPSADLWAFGVLAHQVLTGLHPFLGATARARSLAALAYARGTAPLRLDGALPAPWRPLVTACLAADRARRSEVDLAALLATALREAAPQGAAGPPASPDPGSPDPAPPGTAANGRRRRRAVVAPLLAAAGALLALSGSPEPAVPRPGSAAGSAVTAPLPGAIPPGADVPAALRGPIDDAARRCPEPEITPVLLAAMLKAESGFDPAAARPATGEYGVAMWTPAVFNAWAQDGDHDGVKNHLDPADAIASMGNYVCWLDQRFKQRGFTTGLPALVAAGYRTSDKTVADAGGVPERVKPHVAKVLGYLAEYADQGGSGT